MDQEAGSPCPWDSLVLARMTFRDGQADHQRGGARRVSGVVYDDTIMDLLYHPAFIGLPV